MVKKLGLAALLIAAAFFLSGGTEERQYETKTVKYTVGSGESLWVVAKQYHGQQDKYADIREFIWHIQEDSKLDKRVPLQVGDELTIKLHKERR